MLLALNGVMLELIFGQLLAAFMQLFMHLTVMIYKR